MSRTEEVQDKLSVAKQLSTVDGKEKNYKYLLGLRVTLFIKIHSWKIFMFVFQLRNNWTIPTHIQRENTT